MKKITKKTIGDIVKVAQKPLVPKTLVKYKESYLLHVFVCLLLIGVGVAIIMLSKITKTQDAMFEFQQVCGVVYLDDNGQLLNQCGE